MADATLIQPTDEQLIEGLDKKFRMLGKMVHGVAQGAFNALTIQGEKGLGKSHTVHSILDSYDPSIPGNEEMPEENRRSIKRFTGKITPLQLFLALQEYSAKKCILLFDDCDSAWNDLGALNVLKAACDTKERRVVTWASSARVVREQSFVFNGSVIIITNAHMQSEHYRAFMDRVQRFPLTMTPREKMLKIRQIAMQDSAYDQQNALEVVEEIERNLDLIGSSLSMRTFVQSYKLRMFDAEWREMARETVFGKVL